MILAPDFTENDIETLRKYFEMNKKYYWRINEELTAALTDHPVFGPIMRMMTPEQRRAQNERSLEQQRAAIYDGKWDDYSKELISQGRVYARMNISYSDWYGLIKMYKDHLMPYIKTDFADSVEDAVTFIDGLSKIVDYAMYGIAEAYFQEKNAIIKESEERFRAIFENSVDYIYLIDEQRKIQMINRVPGGKTKEGIIGKSIYESADAGSEFIKGIDTVFKNKIAARFESETTAGDSPKYFASTASPVFDEHGDVHAAVVIAHDITDKKKAEKEIYELNVSLERKVRARTEDLNIINKELESFSYSVSHDLRGPLRAISGFTQILAEELAGNTNEEVKDAMKEIISNSTRMGVLIDDLLEFSRLGKKQVSKVEIGMDELFSSAITDFAKTNDKINFKVKKLGLASGDYGMIRQVVINLLSNAVKYSGKKSNPVIEIGRVEDNGNHAFYVRDNGIGFDMAYYDKLFGVFQRLHSAEEFEGTGVGLAIVQRIINKHSGKVWAEAKVNEGATFYFSLPKN